jgi:hypothetical protein
MSLDSEHPTDSADNAALVPTELDTLAVCGCWLYTAGTVFMTVLGAAIAPVVGLSRVEGAAIAGGGTVLTEVLLTWLTNRRNGASEYEVLLDFDGIISDE